MSNCPTKIPPHPLLQPAAPNTPSRLLLTFSLFFAIGCTPTHTTDLEPQGIRIVDPKAPSEGLNRNATRREASFEMRQRELLRAVENGKPVERVHAAYWLGEMGPAGSVAVTSLIANLTHENEWVRRSAAKALGKIRSERAVPPLIAALKDKNRYVVGSVVLALKNIGTPQARGAVKGY